MSASPSSASAWFALLGRPSRKVAVATTKAEARSVYLKSMKPVDSLNWPLPPAPDGGKLPNFFETISVNGKASPNGIGMHPSFDGPASVSYLLSKPYQTFQAEVSVNDSSGESEAPMTFSVYGDGRLLWKSKPVETPKDTQECKVSVKDVRVLKLQVSANGKARGAMALLDRAVADRMKGSRLPFWPDKSTCSPQR